MISLDDIRKAFMRACCTEKNISKDIDNELIDAAIEEVMKLIEADDSARQARKKLDP